MNSMKRSVLILFSCICLLVSAFLWIVVIPGGLSGSGERTHSELVTTAVADSKETAAETSTSQTQTSLTTTTTVVTTAEPVAKMAADAVALVNGLRAEKGMPPLKVNDNLTACAVTRSMEISQGYNDPRPNGKSWNTIITEDWQEYQNGLFEADCSLDEPIALGLENASAAGVYGTWSANSADQILTGWNGYIGIGCTFVPQDPAGKYYYWSMLLVTDALNVESYQSWIASKLNEERIRAGLKPLEVSGPLSDYAAKRVQEIVTDYKPKTKPDAPELKGKYREYIDKGAGVEIPYDILHGLIDNESYMKDVDLLNANQGQLGIGYYYLADDPAGDHFYWVLCFLYEEPAEPPTEAPTEAAAEPVPEEPVEIIIEEFEE